MGLDPSATYPEDLSVLEEEKTTDASKPARLIALTDFKYAYNVAIEMSDNAKAGK